jgi:hypothetical protein
VTHAGLRAALWRWLDRDEEGKWVLRLDGERFVWVEVEDAPHYVRSARWEGERVMVLLADGGEEELAYGTVRVRGGRVYCLVKNGRFEARVSTAAWGVLGEGVEERDGGRMALRAAGKEWEIGGS